MNRTDGIDAVRVGAVHALQRLRARPEPLLPDLVALLEDPDTEVRESALGLWRDRLGVSAPGSLR